MRLIIFCLLMFYTPAALAANVVVTIKPLYSLVAMIMEGSNDKPVLLVDGNQSLHSFSLKPSQLAQIHKSDVVFLISPHLEMFMDAVIDAAPNNLNFIAMAEQKRMRLLPVRQGNGFDVHTHEGEDKHDHANDESLDLHIWSSPENATIMLKVITDEMIRIDPENQMLYSTNLLKARTRINALDGELRQRMGKLASQHFVTFHDATQYFERTYGLQAIGSITMHPERGTSAHHITEIQQKIRNSHATCVFREPQFEGKIVTQLLQGTSVKSQVIDPEASLLAPSPSLYFELMDGLAKSFEACLG